MTTMSRRGLLAAAPLAAVAGGASAQAQRGGAAAVTTTDGLVRATEEPGATSILVEGRLADVPGIRLRPGQSLLGRDGAEIRFRPGIDGLCLSSDNAVTGLGLHASPDRRALFNDPGAPGLGLIRLAGLVVTGQVQIVARDAVRGGHLEASGVHVAAADTRDRPDRPKGYGVEVLQGAFTLWNMQTDPSVTITADLAGLSAGQPGAPVIGSGILIAGADAGGGTVRASRIETGTIHSEGRIAPGTADLITGAVFVANGTVAGTVRNLGAVTTYGANDMVLDNWGSVDRWIAQERVTSFGPSGSAVVSFGTLAHLRVEALIETHGPGARGFNVYSGRLELAEFDRIVTRGDGAVGLQVGHPVGRILVRRGIETFGAAGPSLVKGVVVTLSAIALSVTPTGSAQEIQVRGGLAAHGLGIAVLEILGPVDALDVRGGLGGASSAQRR